MAPPESLNTTPVNRTASSLAKAGSLPSRAYVTLLAGNGDYVKGVVGLAKGLRKVNTIYPLVVPVLPDVPADHRRQLVEQGCIVREIEPVYQPENQTQFAMAYYAINYSKLRIWEFVEYSKLIYLDGDIQVYDNIDHLFDLPSGYFYAVMDCFCEKTWSHTPQHKIGYCQQRPDKVHWPEELGPKPPLYFNAGMFVFEPSLPTYRDLLRTLKITPPTPFAEQDFLNNFFKDIYEPIPNVDNLVLAMLWLHPENVNLDKVKVVHYCAVGSKPWRFAGEEDNMDREDIKLLVDKWWDIYNDETLDYNPNPALAADPTPVAEAQLAALTEAGVLVISSSGDVNDDETLDYNPNPAVAAAPIPVAEAQLAALMEAGVLFISSSGDVNNNETQDYNPNPALAAAPTPVAEAQLAATEAGVSFIASLPLQPLELGRVVFSACVAIILFSFVFYLRVLIKSMAN